MTLLPFLPQCPADFKLIVQGIGRGRLVQFDRGDTEALERYAAARPAAFGEMAGALEELKRVDRAYRDSQPDITHHHVRLITKPRLWTAIHAAWVKSWRIRGMADEAAAGPLAGNRFAALLFVLLGLLPVLTPVLFLTKFPGRSAGLWLLWLAPLLGPFVRKLWGRGDLRRHYAALLTRSGYLGRAFRGHVAESLIGWHRTGRVSEHRALAIAEKPGSYILNRPLAFLPPAVHRFLTDKAYFKERLRIMFVKPFQLYFKPAVREKWLRDMVEEGRKNRMLSDADAARILAQIDEPYIQKYLKSLAVHLATLFISETVFLTIAAVYILSHPEFGWAEATARAALIVGAFNLLPVSPGSLIRGFYVLGLVVKEKNIKDYRLALPVSFFKIIGYLAFPLQMAYRFPELARFMAGHWATEAVHIVPVFGERGAWLEHAVFDAFYNYPLSLGIRIRKRDELAAAKKPRWGAIPLAALIGARVRNARRLPLRPLGRPRAGLEGCLVGGVSGAGRRGLSGVPVVAAEENGRADRRGPHGGRPRRARLRLDQRLSGAVIPGAGSDGRAGRERRGTGARYPLEDLYLHPARDPRRFPGRDPPALELLRVSSVLCPGQAAGQERGGAQAQCQGLPWTRVSALPTIFPTPSCPI